MLWAQFIAELGPALVVNDQGWHGINFGKFNVLACMLTASDVVRLVGNLRVAGLTATAMEGAVESKSPKIETPTQYFLWQAFAWQDNYCQAKLHILLGTGAHYC